MILPRELLLIILKIKTAAAIRARLESKLVLKPMEWTRPSYACFSQTGEHLIHHWGYSTLHPTREFVYFRHWQGTHILY